MGLRDRGGVGEVQRAEGSHAKGSVPVWCEDARRSKDAKTKQGPEDQQ